LPGRINIFPRIGLLFLAAVLAVFSVCPAPAEAGWFIDPARFHASVHRDVSCSICHDRTIKAHPDPADVNRELTSFFDREVCYACHADVSEEASQGRHGGVAVAPERLSNCLSCHDPHTELGAEQKKAIAGRFDPERPVGWQCGLCHEFKTDLPAPAEEDEACISCHRSVAVNDAVYPLMCLACHGQGEQSKIAVGKIDLTALKLTAHGRMNCLACHSESARFRHAEQVRQDCRACHLPHDAKVAGEVHARVTCEACHMVGLKPTRQARTGWIVGRRAGEAETDLEVHGLVSFQDQTGCRRCHYPENRLGASAQVLPPKSILCAPCHPATLTVGFPVNFTALLIFVLGLAGLGFVFWRASSGSENSDETGHGSVPFWPAVGAVTRALVLDAFLGRRLMKQSPGRWLIHGLIVYAILFRFIWGLIGLVGSLALPGWSALPVLLDPSQPLTAFLFDLTGAMLLVGVLLAMVRRLLARSKAVPDLPRPDYVGMILLALLILTGFVVEGLRLAMAGDFDDKGYAFIGVLISGLFGHGAGLPSRHSGFWYFHFMLTALFVAYLPFGRMLHLVLAPISQAIGAVHRRAIHDKEDKR